MFWKFTNNSSSEIDALLVKEDVTLQEIMDSEDIINQCKVQGKALIDFLLKPDVIEELVSLTTREPSAELDERIRFKYPNIACELLTSDVPAINERLASDKALLDKLYSFLECEPLLNPLLASYFSRIMGALIAKKTEQVLDFLKAKDTFISLLLKHLGTSAIMDLMLKLMTQVESVEMRQNILNWLDSQRLIQSLVSLLNSKVEQDRHYNVAQLLCDFIRVARDTLKNSTERIDPDPLLNTLESFETVSLLLENIFEGERCETAIAGGVQVLLTLLDTNPFCIPKLNSQISYNSNDEGIDAEDKEKVVSATTDAIKVHLKDFHDILLNPPKKPSIQTTMGVLEQPVGNTRLQVAKLFSAVISSNSAKLLQEIVSLGTFPVLLDLFFAYPWNNFLHTQVENCLVSALKTYTTDTDENDDSLNALCKHLLVNCNLIERILKAWTENDEQQKQAKGVRQGYMGHLISIINKIVDLCSNTSFGKFLNDSLPEVAKSLDEFKEGTLKETNAKQDTLLGGAYPNSSNEETDEYNDIAFYPQDQMYSTYQMQHLASHSIEGYSGINDNAFNDGDDTLQTIDDRTDMNFSLADGDAAQQRELFQQVCAQSINTLDDADDQIFEDRDHTFQTVIEKDDQNETVFSSDSDEESSPVVPMEVDPWLSPKQESEVGPLTPVDPWSEALPPSNPELDKGDWADFANFDTVFDKARGEVSDVDVIKSVVENDLKVESIEIDPKRELGEDKAETNDGVANVAQNAIKEPGGDGAAADKGTSGGETSEPSIPQIPTAPPSTIATIADSCVVKSPEPVTSEKKDV